MASSGRERLSDSDSGRGSALAEDAHKINR
jgi:hypothetical protein